MATIEDFTCPCSIPTHILINSSEWNSTYKEQGKTMKEVYESGGTINVNDIDINKESNMVIFISEN